MDTKEQQEQFKRLIEAMQRNYVEMQKRAEKEETKEPIQQKQLETEEIPIFRIYKKNGNYCSEIHREANKYEVIGFLRTFLQHIEYETSEAFQGDSEFDGHYD